ncbi:MAG: hypothetical protein DRR42_16375 [Gammaproteobacteria bacterium]|nr:MAG: hypothetical protein DRR42_16375 [Gammaproteobacteria bacterium]
MVTTFLRLLLFSGFLVISTICQATEATDSKQLSTKIPIIHIAAANLAPLDIGLEIGRQSKKYFADIERRYDSYLMASLSQMGFDDMLRDRLPGLRNTIDTSYQKELEGVASAWSLTHDNKLGDGFLSWDEYWLLNLLPDIGLPANGTGFGILSQLSKEKGTIVGRNLDLKSTPSLRSLQAITVYQYADYAVVNIGFAGIVSVLTGFNESGLFVAHFNAASDSSYQNPYRVRENTNKDVQAQGFILRKALETLTTTQKAINFIAKNSDGISNNTLVADKKYIQILEYSAAGKTTIRRWNSQTHPGKRWNRKSQIAVVDCHVLNSMSDNCIRAKDSYRWERLRSLAVFTDMNKAGVQDIARIMLDNNNKYYEILSANTLQSMIYLPGSGHLYLYAAPINNSAGDNTGIPPFYQVYYQDLIPSELRKPRNKTRYFWWIAGLLILLLFSLWMIRRSVNKNETNSKRLFGYIK